MLHNPYKDIQRVQKCRKVYFQEQQPEEIWAEVLENDHEEMQELCRAMRQLVYEVGVPKFLVHLSAKLLYHFVYRWWGHYTKESDFLASACSSVSPSLMAFLQRQYTLAHMGCSVVMTWDEQEKRMLCFRSLDWKGADDIARATRMFSFVDSAGKEVAKIAGITAMVGVLTGVKEGFSIAINYAPWKRSASFKSDPTFLIRQLLEDDKINSYEDAMQKIRSWDVGSPCFISLCGIEKGEACVIELSHQSKVHIREMGEEKVLIQTNHYDLQSSPFTKHNEPAYDEEMNEEQWYVSELLKNSQKREALMKAEFTKNSDLSMKEKLIQLYKQVPILNWETAQWVIMHPDRGDLKVYASLDKKQI